MSDAGAVGSKTRDRAAEEPRLRDLRRALLRVVVCALVAAAIVTTASGCEQRPFKSSSIHVTGLDELPYERFVYNISNTGLASDGANYWFTLSTGQTEFFDGLRRSYQVFDQSDDSLQLIYHQQIYTVRRYADGHYALYRELFRFIDEGREFRQFPFPTGKMPGGDQDPPHPRVGTEFHTTADLPYLLRFYQVYGDAVKVDGNTITFAGCSITMEPGGLVKVAGPPVTTVPSLSDAEVTKEATAQLREKMQHSFIGVTLDTLELKLTSYDGRAWDFEGVATAHWTADGGALGYDVTAHFVQGIGLDGWSWFPRED